MHQQEPGESPVTDALHVTLNYGPLGLVRATPRELRPDGMTVDTGIVSLTGQSDVEVTFSFRKDDRTQVHRIGASVAGASPLGAELIFHDNDRETYHALWELLRRH